ncbi:MAG: translocation/assembly module TamB domain-containing protein, partial [Myxococcota bacterium]
RRFDVEQGALIFDGASELDPAVTLVAVYSLRGQPGETVTVTASGTLSNLAIEFSSTLTNDRAEIIALLVSGNVRQDTAAQAGRETQNFLNGVLSGALTLTLREEFGAYIPNFTVQANDLGGNRYGGGWNIERLLPAKLRDVILGFYVEGFVSTQDGEGSTGQLGTEVGVRVELDFPRAVQASGTFSQFGWSADVTWTP